ncbi:sugar O-acyltransferase (sialic acid O-acetyltransferase NeuD family) [Gillisia mitskevichiae]|uniref:Sugar O-acyltransferase (Sialic acid O-acetyltransferase NeuD family) n=1 Tax=Gillisia mitskevichiae TaxID=270921 RepID=A0A495PIJ8_9FLAO|nr:acetyltransferase [Gillisia mitskevichiae]RKS50571.1 sugar O-acyltransferase (sialic acid O-acetyltransferase NeuD family) [Gillisia mitskevichiae]
MNIYGASGHGKVIIDIAESINIPIEQIFDDNKNVSLLNGTPVIHDLDEIFLDSETIIAIGNNRIRKKVADSFTGRIADAIIHNSAIISPRSSINKGSVIMPSACVNSSTVIGKHCIINTASTIDHDCELGDYVHISPNAAIAGNVIIKEGTHIGIGAVVIPGIKIGKWATVGAGAVIINDIPDYAVVVGNPGKVIKYLN